MAQNPRSVRFDAELERRLQRAAHRKGVPPSHLIREAVARFCDQILAEDPLEPWHGFLGGATTWTQPPAAVPRTAFESYLDAKHAPARRRKLP